MRKVIEEVAEPEETPQVEEVVEAEQEVEVQPIGEDAEVSQAGAGNRSERGRSQKAQVRKRRLLEIQGILQRDWKRSLRNRRRELEKSKRRKSRPKKKRKKKKEAASVKEEDAVPTDLTEEQKYNFSYFATVAGLSQQIASALHMVMKKMKSTDQTSRVGNLIILGAEGQWKVYARYSFCKDDQ